MKLRSYSSRLLSLLVLSLLFTACSDDEEGDILHYYNPILSPDGTKAAFAIESRVGVKVASRQGTANLAVRTLATGAETSFFVGDNLEQSRYWFTPDGSAIAVIQNELNFYTLEGALAGTFVSDFQSASPSAIAFNGNDRMVWATVLNNRLLIGEAEFSNAPWVPLNEDLLVDDPLIGEVWDLQVTNSNTVLVYLKDGTIREYATNGSILNQLTVEPFGSSDPWKNRIHFFFSRFNGRSFVYVLDKGGIRQANLTDDIDSLIIINEGNSLNNFTISDETSLLLLETSNNDIWRSNENGQIETFFRIKPGHTMASISEDGKSFVAVGLVNSSTDSLSVIRLVQ